MTIIYFLYSFRKNGILNPWLLFLYAMIDLAAITAYMAGA